jgi:endonuclease/exonuclease/phosphatase family metal-dependent hydrolase
MQSISILNLNMMHGRNNKNPVFPLFVNEKKIRTNLLRICDLISTKGPDIVTLQELDKFSIFSGRFNQFEFLHNNLKYPFTYFAESCSINLIKPIFISGNAIFSKFLLTNCRSFKFDLSFPNDRMGFAVADILLPNKDIISVVSAHLTWINWIKSNSKQCELDIMKQAIIKIKNKLIISGDFNCDFADKNKLLENFIGDLDLRSFCPDQTNLYTYPAWKPNRRIDWIFTSNQFQFVNHINLPEQLSDHLATYVDLSF